MGSQEVAVISEHCLNDLTTSGSKSTRRNSGYLQSFANSAKEIR